MKILVISDSHGNAPDILRTVSVHPDAELLIFLGDGLRDLELVRSSFPQTMAVIAVSGNCDFFTFGGGAARDEELIALDGYRIFACHGHRFGVKGGLGGLASAAHSRGADVALFGHTHTPHEGLDYCGEHALRLFNPGSLGRSGDGCAHYGILDLRKNGICFSCAILR